MHDERPRLHLTPPTGWMNDPNGMCFANGMLHMTYQYNPDAPEWGRMSWGHAETRDLLRWEHLPIALAPGHDGPDSFGCWSGCIVDDGSGARLFYTGVRLDGEERIATICQATSTDPMRLDWVKDRRGPVIGGPPGGVDPERFRDPFVWREDDGWCMVVGGATLDDRGVVLLYRSQDLDQWHLVGPILTSDQVDHFPDGSALMWECPQVLRFDDRYVLIVSVIDRAPAIRPSHVVAFEGRLTDDRFVVDGGRRLAMGPDFYAPAAVRTPDARWLLFGWVPEDPPGPGTDRTWAGSLSFPRIVSLAGDGRISLALADEVTAARRDGSSRGARHVAAHEPPFTFAPPKGAFELALELRPGPGSEIRVELHDADPVDPLARVSYHEHDRQLVIARRGIVSVAGRSSMSAETVELDAVGAVHLRILVDGSVLELEANGDTMGTVRLASHRPAARSIAIVAATGEARIETLEVWPLGD
jgi:beta-fructofuranosidase